MAFYHFYFQRQYKKLKRQVKTILIFIDKGGYQLTADSASLLQQKNNHSFPEPFFS
ncbi:hypothetical protein NEOC84_000605|nr:hypothetical protein [Neochlamydia sp. AcF84]